MTSDGSAYVRFRGALEIGNELLVSAAARELPRTALDDALRICLVLRDGDADRYQRAAVRWLGRFALEARDVTIDDLRRAAEALDALRDRITRRWSASRACASPTETDSSPRARLTSTAACIRLVHLNRASPLLALKQAFRTSSDRRLSRQSRRPTSLPNRSFVAIALFRWSGAPIMEAIVRPRRNARLLLGGRGK